MSEISGDSKQTSSTALHAGAGFRVIGTFEAVDFKLDRWRDSVLMQRPLGQGATTGPC